MPHASDSRRIEDPFGATDEVKVYKDEGEDEKPENLSEEKFGLVTETEEGKSTSNDIGRLPADDDTNATRSSAVKLSEYLLADHFPFGCPLIPPYAYPNGSSGKIFPSHPGFGFYMYGAAAAAAAAAGGGDDSGTETTYPPPAHMGIQPLYVDSKTAGLARQALYRLTPSPSHPSHSLYSPTDLTHIQCFDLLSRASPFHCSPPYPPPPVPLSSRSPLTWFGPPPPPPSGLLSYGPAVLSRSRTGTVGLTAAVAGGSSPPPLSAGSTDTCTRRTSFHGGGGTSCSSRSSATMTSTSVRSSRHHDVVGLQSPADRRREYVKKPLNAFMLFMKEKRQRVIEECTLKESAAINQILGRKWHALGRAEQAKYYEMARKEKELHMQLHPGWSARDNYATHTKKKKKKAIKRDVIPQHQQPMPHADVGLHQPRTVKDDPDRSLYDEKGCINLSHGLVSSRSRPCRSSVDDAGENSTSNGLGHDPSRPVSDHFHSPASPSICRLAL